MYIYINIYCIVFIHSLVPDDDAADQISCPPERFDSVSADEISIPAYISKPWFIQQQIPVQYQTENQLYCVRAAYKQLEEDLFEVYNYANNDEVNGTPQVTGDSFRLVGEIPDASDPAKLQVGIAGLGGRPAFAGPYWIVAIDTDNIDDPQWAIVVGGPPDTESNGRCLYTIRGFNGNGFWLFTRDQVASPEMIQMMRDRAAELGMDVESLLPVMQEGCEYDGAFDPQA
jgi:lipocalin